MSDSVYVFFVCSSFKLLLSLYGYRSTDFDVHRTWLSLTNRQKIADWYGTETVYAIDYPPAFTYFQYLLSLVVDFFDPKSLDLESEVSFKTVLLLRLTVSLSDLILLLAIRFYVKRDRSTQACALVLTQFSLFAVDYVHFQYNSFLIAILVFACALVERRNYKLAAVVYSILINTKHIYLYVAPGFFFCLLHEYVFQIYDKEEITTLHSYYDKKQKKHVKMNKPGLSTLLAVERLIILAQLVVATSFLIWAPFLYLGQGLLILRRMFPFDRGLTHTYWSPNLWSLYQTLDRVIFQIFRFFPFNFEDEAPCTGGIKCKNVILPEISPLLSSLLSLLVVVFLARSLVFYSTRSFGTKVAFTNLLMYFVAYHAHEKAVIPSLVLVLLNSLPLKPGKDRTSTRLGQDLLDLQVSLNAVVGISLLPLFRDFKFWFTPYSLYVFSIISSVVYFHHVLPQLELSRETRNILLLSLTLLPLLEFLGLVLVKYEFLPSLLVSLFSAVAYYRILKRFFAWFERQK